VIAEIATSIGSRVESIIGKSITTDVSITPRGGRASATRCRVLIDHRVHILPKAPARNAWGSGESGMDDVGRDEDALAERVQLADRDTVPRDDERSPSIEIAHDASAVVAELSLGDPSRHAAIVARALRSGPRRLQSGRARKPNAGLTPERRRSLGRR
jgi:hypothetical protein